MKRYLFIIIFTTCLGFVSSGQSLDQFSMRNYNMMVFNPAIAGSNLTHIISLHHRSQWVGFDGAPSSQFFSYNGTIFKKVGIGAYLYNDIAGPFHNIRINMTYAYHLTFPKFNLSLGVSVSGSRFKFDNTKLILRDPDDDLINGAVTKTRWIPDVTAGALFYNKDFYAGISTTNMMKSKAKNDASIEALSRQYLYLMGGYDFKLGKSVVLTPELLGATDFYSFLGEVGVKATFLNAFNVGVRYRTSTDLVMLAGIKILKFAYLAYSYDLVLSSLAEYQKGSHEILLAITISDKPRRKNSLFKDKIKPRKNRRDYWD